MSTMANEFSGLPIAELIGGPLQAACDAQVRLAQATASFINTVGFVDDNGKLAPRQVDFSFWQPLPLETKYTVASVAITNGGSGYTAAPTVAFTGGGGTEATGVATFDVVEGKVTGVNIINGGKGYTSAPTVTFSPPPAGGITAAGTAIIAADTSQKSETSVQKVMLSIPFLAIVNVPALMVKNVDVVFDMEVKSSETHKDSTDFKAGLEAEGSGKWGAFTVRVKITASVATHKENTRSTDKSAKYHIQVTARDDGMPEGLSRVLDILQRAIAPVGMGAATDLSKANIANN